MICEIPTTWGGPMRYYAVVLIQWGLGPCDRVVHSPLFQQTCLSITNPFMPEAFARIIHLVIISHKREKGITVGKGGVRRWGIIIFLRTGSWELRKSAAFALCQRLRCHESDVSNDHNLFSCYLAITSIHCKVHWGTEGASIAVGFITR